MMTYLNIWAFCPRVLHIFQPKECHITMAVESVSLKTVELLANKVLGYFGSNTFLDTNIHAPFGCWVF